MKQFVYDDVSHEHATLAFLELIGVLLSWKSGPMTLSAPSA